MNKREKIAQLLCKQTGSNDPRECESCPFNGCIAQRQADALIAAGYDVECNNGFEPCDVWDDEEEDEQ